MAADANLADAVRDDLVQVALQHHAALAQLGRI